MGTGGGVDPLVFKPDHAPLVLHEPPVTDYYIASAIKRPSTENDIIIHFRQFPVRSLLLFGDPSRKPSPFFVVVVVVEDTNRRSCFLIADGGGGGGAVLLQGLRVQVAASIS